MLPLKWKQCSWYRNDKLGYLIYGFILVNVISDSSIYVKLTISAIWEETPKNN